MLTMSIHCRLPGDRDHLDQPGAEGGTALVGEGARPNPFREALEMRGACWPEALRGASWSNGRPTSRWETLQRRHGRGQKRWEGAEKR